MKITNLYVNHLEKPLGYDMPYLHFSWQVTEAIGTYSANIRLQVAVDKECNNLKYDSGIISEYCLNQLDAEIELNAKTRYYWRVYITDEWGNRAVSKTSWFETGKEQESWGAQWIAPAEENSECMPVMYRDFTVGESLQKARIYLFGAGLYELYINSHKVGEEYLLPGYHSYDFRMEYQTFDITNYLKAGTNRIEILLGEGWYKGRFGFDGVYYNLYGNRKKCIAELEILYTDGRKQFLCTDRAWKAKESTVGSNGIYDGESIDDTAVIRELPIEILHDTRELLIARSNPAIRKVEEIAPVSIQECMQEEGESIQTYQLLDFGEAITGWVELEPYGTKWLEPKQRIHMLYGEVLQNEQFYRGNLRSAKCEFHYTSNGIPKTVRPHFTFYGFRYVKVMGLKENQKIRFRAFRLMSDIRQTGRIISSNAKINQLAENTLRSQKCNFLDIPTDCPQRDERMGWTGDAGIFADTANFHMDSSAFFRHYMKSLRAEQEKLNGAVPFFVPLPKVPREENTNPFYKDAGTAVWGDAAVMIPWSCYQCYGDISLLREQYPIMHDWVEFVYRRTQENPIPYLWQNDKQLGDWLALDNGNIYNPIGRTDAGLIASLYFYWSASTLAKASAVLAYKEDLIRYQKLAANIRTAFLNYYFDEAGRLKSEATQTACALILHMDLCMDSGRAWLKKKLGALIESEHGHLNTGFVGTVALCPALSEAGMNRTACQLLLNEEYPGWLHEVKMGATTVWERWNSLEEDGSISGTGMNSLNHYAYGSIAGWMYRYLCGLRPQMGEAVRMVIRPMPDVKIQMAEAQWESPYGKYISRYEYEDKNRIHFHVVVPFNSNAKVILSDKEQHLLQAGEYDFYKIM